VMMFCVSQNPVIMTSTCSRLRPRAAVDPGRARLRFPGS
jgi:hypothetical protein